MKPRLLIGVAMRVPFLLAIVLGYFTTLAQVDTLGLDDDPLLTQAEADYLNDKFESQRGQFDFQNKRIAFVTGSAGSKFIAKQEYFSDVRQWAENDSEVVSSLYILTEGERQASGYDAIVTAWVKVLTNKRRGKLVRQLQDGH